jgi:hypothetical protein
MDGKRKRQQSPPTISNLLFDEQSKIHKRLAIRETQSKITRINTKNKTFYKFRNLINNHLIHSLLSFLNHNNVNFYIINYENQNNINITCFNARYETTSFDAQSEPIPIIPDNEGDELRTEMITNEIFGHLNNETYLIGNNVDFLNYVYFNENGTCFYFIRNPAFFDYMKEIDGEINVSNDNMDLDIFINPYAT